ncbi:non-ribosomal peptide synthetase [Fischerella thermalis]|uniref:Non-ribosomal peptide synthetase n=1 Tax=Fischerella thermalis CCMEE 5318 TaxID=2019666 RepID=A0A2N6LHI1_9CYAN|nr:non-ribosomal peptide synthetase [Fischerella thermalis]PMB23519.1 non-ribosomal peptide synthetase [Fischerella thermalis CCMEE 5318]
MTNKLIHGFKLSPQQRHLWLLQQETNSFPYRSYCTIEITGNLKIENLKTALHSVIRKHQILSTRFRYLPGMTIPLQVIENDEKLLIQEHDLRTIPPEEQKNAVELLIESAKQQIFDFEKSSSLQISLAILSASKYVLLLNLSSLYADATSLKNLVAEINRAYTGNLPDEEPVQYIVFSDWQNELLESEAAEIGREYWRQKDIAHIFDLKLPNEKILSGQIRFEPQIFTHIIPNNLTTKITTIAEKFNTNESTFLLTCWQILLWRLTNVSNIVVGTNCDGRPEEELQEILGLLAKYVPVNCHLQSSLKFHEVLQEIDFSQNQAYEWQDCFNWELILESDKFVPFFPFCFDFIEQRLNFLVPNAVTFSLLQQYVCFDKFKVKLSFIRTDNSLHAEWHYDSELFLPEDIERLAGQFHTLLESATNNPYALLSELEILSDIERQQLLVDFNKTQTDFEFSTNKCFHQIFTEQVLRTPDNIAVVYKNQQFTYQELNNLANQLAHYLQQLGVKPDVMVGLCVERSPLMLIGLLGILKAGGAYVPIDPSYPLERKNHILNDSRMPVLLTQQHLIADLDINPIQVVCIDSDWQVISQQKIDNPTTTTTELNLAYVIYTSGSTGKPKGTLIPHQGLANYLNWATQRYAVEQGVGTLVHSPLGFDLTITSLLSPLLVGRTVELLPEEQGIETLSQALAKSSNLSLVKITPAHLDLLKQQLSQEEIANKTRAFIIGGENLLAQSITFWQDVAPDTILVNEYGPTETVVGCCVYQVPVGKHSSGSIPIGKPIANTQLYILDQSLQPVPMGVPGELHIGGLGLARGYLNQSDLTALKFIPNPFSNKQGDRLYKTGDLARYLPSGDIEYIGRIDNQVKVRGFRIELGEIEAIISQYPAVRETVVVVSEESVNSQRIIAYIVPHKEQTLTIPELRSFLESKLPSYMVPASFVTLDTIPLTPNGKVDRKALPAPDTVRPELKEIFVAPQTTIEKQLAAIWSEVLGLEKIGINDNFFTLGGDSILSLQVIFKANQLGLNLTSKQLFQHQTIAQLAAVAGTTRKIQAEQMIVTGLVELTPIQHWFFEQKQPEPDHWNQAVFLESKQKIDPVVLEKIIESLQKHHDVLRLRFIQEEFSTQAFIVRPDDQIPLTCFDFAALPEDKQAKAIAAAANKLQASLNLSQGPLFRVALFNLGDNQAQRLLWIVHHLVVDGVSWRILLEDFQTAYQQISQGKAINLPPKTTSYQQWSSCLQKYAQSSALLSELDFWLAMQHKSVAPIPRDFSNGNNTEETTSTLSVSLSTEETQSLLQQVPAAYRTQINDVLLTALILTFNQWTGENSLLIDLEGHGREEIFEDVDLSRTVGWFTTIFPVHLNLENANDLGKALKSIKEQLRAIPNRGIGYGLLRYLSQDKEIAKQFSKSKAEVAFNYLGQFAQVLPESSLFNLTQELSGSTKSLRNQRTHLLEINAGIYQGNLEMSWSYSHQLHRHTTIDALAQNFIETLRSLISHCQSPDVGDFTPSDFADFQQSQWDQTDLDAITAAMGDI